MKRFACLCFGLLLAAFAMSFPYLLEVVFEFILRHNLEFYAWILLVMLNGGIIGTLIYKTIGDKK